MGRRMRFVTLFPECENIHLMKEQGMIPYFMSKVYGMEGIIACYGDETFQTYGEQKLEYLDQLKDGLSIDKIKNTGDLTRDGINYLIKNSCRINILYIFHLSERSLYWYTIYKFLNHKGKVYLELDANRDILNFKFDPYSIRHHLEKRMLKKCDLVSTSIQSLSLELSKKWNTNIQYIPRGFYTDGIKKEISPEQKEDLFCTVGRIGTWVKATEILLEGFRLFAIQNKTWKLKIIGPIEKEFEEYVEQYFNYNPELKSRIIFTGGIYNKHKLDIEYAKAKIFCITSRSEAFALVYAEALKNGCFILSSKVDCVDDVLKTEEYGSIFEIDDSNQLAEKMLELSQKDSDWYKVVCRKAQKYAYEEYFWPNICNNIYHFLYNQDKK